MTFPSSIPGGMVHQVKEAGKLPVGGAAIRPGAQWKQPDSIS